MKPSDEVLRRCVLAMLEAGKAVVEREEGRDMLDGQTPQSVWDEADEEARGEMVSVVQAVLDAVEPDYILVSQPTPTAPVYPIGPDQCAVHVASDDDPKICRHCGTNVEEYRDEPREEE